MVNKIQLTHPQGKKAVSIELNKYNLLYSEILEFFTKNEEGTFSDFSSSIAQRFIKRKLLFEGSLNWYLEWVKLDMEANNIIQRIEKTSPQRYRLAKIN